eukprot:scaffold4233_cov180-Ochromonas_danica.AAC.27
MVVVQPVCLGDEHVQRLGVQLGLQEAGLAGAFLPQEEGLHAARRQHVHLVLLVHVLVVRLVQASASHARQNDNLAARFVQRLSDPHVLYLQDEVWHEVDLLEHWRQNALQAEPAEHLLPREAEEVHAAAGHSVAREEPRDHLRLARVERVGEHRGQAAADV